MGEKKSLHLSRQLITVKIKRAEQNYANESQRAEAGP